MRRQLSARPQARLLALPFLIIATFLGADGLRKPARADHGPDCVRSAQPAVPTGDPTHPYCRREADADYCYQCAETTTDVPGKPYWICSGPADFESVDDPNCGHFAMLPSWFGSLPDEQSGDPALNQDPGLGDDGE